MGTRQRLTAAHRWRPVGIEIGADLRAEAEHRAAHLPVYARSHRETAANLVGCLGEVIVEHALTQFDVPYRAAYETTHDLIVSDRYTIEIKTKDRTVPPRADYEASLPAYNHDHQQPDFFVFVSLERDRLTDTGFHTGWLVGVADPAIIDEHRELRRANETDPDNGTTFWTDCWNVRCDVLRPFPYAANYWRRRRFSSNR